MIKLIRVCFIILFFIFFQVNVAKAIDFNLKYFDKVEIVLDGQVFIDSQRNGVCYDFIKGVVETEDISIIIEESGWRKTYTDINERILNNNIRNFLVEVDSFSEDANIIINAKLISNDFDLDMLFSKSWSVKELKSNIQKTSNKTCIIEITADDIEKIITHDVIFEIEEGGKFLDSDTEQYVEYINILNGKEFPHIPEFICDDNYEFIGWYNCKTGEKIREFPVKVEDDVIVSVKFGFAMNSSNDNYYNTKLNETNKELETTKVITTRNVVMYNNIEATKDFISDNPPKSYIDNNIVLLIVSYIIKLTVNIV